MPIRSEPAPLTNIQKIRLIEETLEREIKPALHQDGGGIELVDVDGERVMVKTARDLRRLQCLSGDPQKLRGSQAAGTGIQDLVVEEVRS